MDTIRQYKSLFIAEGIVFILLGLLAVTLPGLFTFAIEFLVGILFIVAGIVQGWRTFQTKNVPGFLLSLLITILYIAAGIILLANPVQGVLTLTLVLTVFFIIEGIAQIILAFQYRGHGYFGWRVLSGVISLVLAYLIFAGWPGTAAWVIGLLVGINLIFSGVTQLFLVSSVSDTNK